ncbi:MAG: hypothetical protein ACI8ZO_001145, partial [Flavobacteriales bacterium]
QDWFETKIPKTKMPADFISNTLSNEALPKIKSSAKVYWLGAEPKLNIRIKKKKGQEFENAHLTIHSRDNQLELKFPKGEGEWLSKTLMSLDLANPKATTLSELQADYENLFPNFELFWNSKALQQLKQEGLLVL